MKAIAMRRSKYSLIYTQRFFYNTFLFPLFFAHDFDFLETHNYATPKELNSIELIGTLSVR
jgi:hypothetical protein